MQIEFYIRLVRQWWWVAVMSAVILGGTFYSVSRGLQPLYQAKTVVFIGGFLTNPNPVRADITTGSQLAKTYSNLVVMRPILDDTIDELHLNLTPQELEAKIGVSLVQDTSFLTITVDDRNPRIAADIANELVNQLILHSPTLTLQRQQGYKELLEREVDALNVEVRLALERVNTINDVLEGSDSLSQDESLLVERNELVTQIGDWQSTIVSLSSVLSTYETQRQSLSVIEPAFAPENPFGPPVFLITIISMVLAGLLTIGFAIAWEYFDDSFSGTEDVRETLDLPVLAGVTKFGQDRQGYSDKLVTLHSPNSTAVECYRALRTNLLYGSEENESIQRIVVTSSREKEGKSVTAANIAVILAKAEFNTVLIDADMHRPQVHNIFDLSNRVGLSTLFKMNRLPAQKLEKEDLNQLLQPTVLPYLKVITSGPIPANPAELVALPHLKDLCQSLEENDTDIIIFDSPPTLNVVDSMILASNIDGSVIVVVNSEKAHRRDVISTITRLQQVDIKVAGIVLNKVSSKSEKYSYYYSYGAYGPAGD